MLEEKYSLLNKVISGELTKEQAIALKAKHIKITNQVYQNCMEIKNTENENNAEQYYCYSEEQKIFDHIAITDDNLIKIIGSL